MDPQNYLMRAKQAELAFRKGDYKAARDGYMDLLKENHYDDSVRIGMVRANQMMIQENLEKLKKIQMIYKQRWTLAGAITKAISFRKQSPF